eukprot:scaffold81511_cov54-Phaeocystis_antarctica.AAC.1
MCSRQTSVRHRRGPPFTARVFHRLLLRCTHPTQLDSCLVEGHTEISGVRCARNEPCTLYTATPRAWSYGYSFRNKNLIANKTHTPHRPSHRQFFRFILYTVHVRIYSKFLYARCPFIPLMVGLRTGSLLPWVEGPLVLVPGLGLGLGLGLGSGLGLGLGLGRGLGLGEGEGVGVGSGFGSGFGSEP